MVRLRLRRTRPDATAVAPEPSETSAAASETSIPTTIPIDVPAPGRIDAGQLRAGLAVAGQLLILSPRSRRLPVALVAPVAAVWAAAIGLLAALTIVLVAGVTEPGFAPASLLWLVGNHVPVETDSGVVSLLPLGAMILSIAPLRRSGRFVAAQTHARHRRPVAIAACLGYALIAALVAAGQREHPSAGLLAAVLWALVLAALAGGWGLLRQSRGRVPTPPFVIALGVCVGVPLVIGALLTAAVLLQAMPQMVEAQAALAGSPSEQIGLLLLQIGYLPNLVIWAGALAIGSGFGVGSDQRLSPFTGAEPVLPDVPMLSAIPAAAPTWTALLPILVALGGVLGAVVFARILPEPRLRRRMTRAIALSLATGAVWWVLVGLSDGALGDGRLENLGPAGGTVVLVTLLTGAGALLWALLPTLASDARPVAADLRERVSAVANEAKEVRIPVGKR